MEKSKGPNAGPNEKNGGNLEDRGVNCAKVWRKTHVTIRCLYSINSLFLKSEKQRGWTRESLGQCLVSTRGSWVRDVAWNKPMQLIFFIAAIKPVKRGTAFFCCLFLYTHQTKMNKISTFLKQRGKSALFLGYFIFAWWESFPENSVRYEKTWFSVAEAVLRNRNFFSDELVAHNSARWVLRTRRNLFRRIFLQPVRTTTGRNLNQAVSNQ